MSGCPSTCTNPENIKISSSLLDEDRRVTLRELEERLGISKSTIDNIITVHLSMSRDNLYRVGYTNCYLIPKA